MFIDVTKYRHYDKLAEIVKVHMEEFEEWKTKYWYEDRMQVTKYHHPDVYPELANIKDDTDAYHRPEGIPDRPNPKENWYCDAIHSVGQKGPAWDDWKRTAELTFALPGVTQHIVNFIRPHTKLRDHDDFGGWQRNAKDMGLNELNGYSLSLGLSHINDKKKMGIMMKHPFADINQYKSWGNGEIVAFEGKTHMHRVYNDCDEWRVTCIIDIEQSHFDLDPEEQEYLNTRWATYKKDQIHV